MEVATLFLILVSVMMRAQEESKEEMIATSSSWHDQDMRPLLLHLLKGWKKKQLGKMSMIQDLGENSLLSESNAGNTSLNLLSILTTEPLIISC